MTYIQRIIASCIMIAGMALLTISTATNLLELFPLVPVRRTAYQWILIVVTSVLCIVRLFEDTKHMILRRVQPVINGVAMLALAQFFYVLLGLLLDVINRITRSRAIRGERVILGLSLLFLLVCLYGMIWGKYRYTIKRETIACADLPVAFDGITIVQVSDIHSGSFDNAARVSRGIDIIKQQNADIFVFTGDLVNNTAHEFHQWKALFKDIVAPLGQYSILGNHDYGDYVGRPNPAEKANNLDLLKQHHADLGRRLLLNEHLVIEKDGQQLVIAGVENWGDGFAKYGDLGKALEGVRHDLFTLLLSHDPTHWDKQIISHDKHVHLTLSGHTHAMQMGFRIGKRRRSPIKYRYKKRSGLYEHAGQYLYINKGFGFLGLSARIGMWPEITVLTLRRKAPTSHP